MNFIPSGAAPSPRVKGTISRYELSASVAPSATSRDLTTPTFVIDGAVAVLPLTEAERTSQGFAHARCTPIADARHTPSQEASDAFFAAVNAFR